MHCEEITKENLDEAIQVQHAIFPKEDGSFNLLASTDKELMKKFYVGRSREYLTFWLCKNEDGKVVGITGIYAYEIYPEDAWCGWYGILPEFQGQGYGKKLLLWTMDKAKELGYKNFRLYTDLIDNATAVSLYRKLGMIEETYTVEDMSPEKITIFSKSLISNESTILGDKILHLREQSDLQKRAKELKSTYFCDKT